MRGTLSSLRNADFASSTNACSGNDLPSNLVTDYHLPVIGDGDWYLVRASNTCGAGSYDEGSASQVGSRDAGIGASGNACP